MIRVVVVDDEALVRSGFQLILNLAPDIEVVATADGLQALDADRPASARCGVAGHQNARHERPEHPCRTAVGAASTGSSPS